jgi:hypothetical protein
LNLIIVDKDDDEVEKVEIDEACDMSISWIVQ